MFTGIIEHLGIVNQISRNKLIVQTGLSELKVGESIAVNGCCLTVSQIQPISSGKKFLISFDLMPETIKRTYFSQMKKGDIVNLEQALKIGDTIGGHFMSGHIDETGKVKKINKKDNAILMEIKIIHENAKYIIPKGSVAVDGISLTVAEKKQTSFVISLIPHTYKNTNLGKKKVGSPVNIEYDLMVKNTVTILKEKIGNKNNITEKYLKDKGF